MRALLMNNFTKGSRLILGDGRALFLDADTPMERLEQLAAIIDTEDEITGLVTDSEAVRKLEAPLNQILKTRYGFDDNDYIEIVSSNIDIHRSIN